MITVLVFNIVFNAYIMSIFCISVKKIIMYMYSNNMGYITFALNYRRLNAKVFLI